MTHVKKSSSPKQILSFHIPLNSSYQHVFEDAAGPVNTPWSVRGSPHIRVSTEGRTEGGLPEISFSRCSVHKPFLMSCFGNLRPFTIIIITLANIYGALSEARVPRWSSSEKYLMYDHFLSPCYKGIYSISWQVSGNPCLLRSDSQPPALNLGNGFLLHTSGNEMM